MTVNYHQHCCGLREMTGLSVYSQPKTAMIKFCEVIYPDPIKVHERYMATLKRYEADVAIHKGDRTNYIGVQHPLREALQGGANYITDNAEQYSRFRFITFTQATTSSSSSKYGEKFADFIKASKFGEVTKTGTHKNPNSGSDLTVFVWAIDHTTLKPWYQAILKNTIQPAKLESMLGPFGGVNYIWGENQLLNGIGYAGAASAPSSQPQGNCLSIPDSAPGPSNRV